MPTPSRAARPNTVGRPKIPFDRIVDAALAIVDAEGAEALTLRALAMNLGSSTATLYRHVESRADLVGHVVERVFSEIELDSAELEGAPWDHVCAQIATAMFAAAARHPNAARLLADTVPTGPRAMAFRERFRSALMAANVTPDLARTFTAVIGRFVLGFAMQVLPGPTDDHEANERLRRADPTRYPTLHATAGIGTSSITEEFNLGLDLLLAGMRARYVSERPAARASAKRRSSSSR